MLAASDLIRRLVEHCYAAVKNNGAGFPAIENDVYADAVKELSCFSLWVMLLESPAQAPDWLRRFIHDALNLSDMMHAKPPSKGVLHNYQFKQSLDTPVLMLSVNICNRLHLSSKAADAILFLPPLLEKARSERASLLRQALTEPHEDLRARVKLARV
jgi:hypothetical protein